MYIHIVIYALPCNNTHRDVCKAGFTGSINLPLALNVNVYIIMIGYYGAFLQNDWDLLQRMGMYVR